MNTRMMEKRRCAALALALLLLLPAAAFAQGPYNVIAVTSNNSYAGADYITQDFQDAITQVADGGRIIVDVGVWNVSPVTLSRELTIVANSGIDPWKYVLSAQESGPQSGPLFDVSAGAKLTIEGISLFGGNPAVLVSGTATSHASVTLRRCYIRGSESNGVTVGNYSDAEIGNCSIVKNAEGHHGVQVSGEDTELDMYFCSLIENGKSGIKIGKVKKSSVVNTLMHKNGEYGGDFSGADSNLTLKDNVVTKNQSGQYNNPPSGAPAPIPMPGDDPQILGDSSPNPPFTAWYGQMDSASELKDKVPGTGLSSNAFKDLDGQVRPFNGLSDIGADEYSTESPTTVRWEACVITPKATLIAGEPVGTDGANVTIRLSNAAGDIKGFWIPQGGQRDNLDHRQFVALTYRGAGYYEGKINSLTTQLGDADGSGSISAGDLIADGHAVFYLIIEGTVLTVTNSQVVLQAKAGRHFTVDTIPPEVDYYCYTDQKIYPGSAPLGGDTTPIFVDNASAGPYAALSVDGATHPGLPLPTTPLQQADDGFIRSSVAPYPHAPFDSLGFLAAASAPVKGAQVFFNTGSRSNNPNVLYASPDYNLKIRIGLRFADPPVRDKDGKPVGSAPDETLSELTTRGPSGFEPGNGTATSPQELVQNTAAGWESISGRSLGSNAVNIQYTYGATNSSFSGGSSVYPPNFSAAYTPQRYKWNGSTGVLEAVTNDGLSARWSFLDVANSAEGIPYSYAPLQTGMRFVAKDRAGNGMESDTAPLNLYWMTGRPAPQTRISQNLEGQTFSPRDLSVSWRIERNNAPEVAGTQPRPAFVYRFWELVTGVMAPGVPQGPYQAITDLGGNGINGWSSWTSDTVLSTAVLESLLQAKPNRWLLLTVFGVDEAGNVDPWPANELGVDAAGRVYTVSGVSSGRNWCRFRLGEGVDTQVLWNLERLTPDPTTFGAATLVPYRKDDDLQATFTLNGVFPNGPHVHRVQWELSSNPESLPKPPGINGVVNAGGQYVVGKLGNEYLKVDTRPLGTTVTYVLRATAFLDENGNATLDTDEVADTSPATVQFTVVKSASGTKVGVPDYTRRPRDTDEQPVRMHEVKP